MKGFVKKALYSTLAASTVTLSISSFAANTSNANPPVSPEEKAKIEEVVHQYLISKPEVILEAIQVLQNKQFAQAKEAVQKTQQDAPRFINALFHQADNPMAGNPNGKVTLVEFFDYQCPHCIDMAHTLDAAIKSNPELRVVYKEWPIRGPISQYAAQAALAANKQGKYLEFHHALLSATQPLTQDSILQVAKQAGLNTDKLLKDMNDPSIVNQVNANMKLAQELKLFGTPAFFIGQTNAKMDHANIIYIPGELNSAQLQSAIDKANGNPPVTVK